MSDEKETLEICEIHLPNGYREKHIQSVYFCSFQSMFYEGKKKFGKEKKGLCSLKTDFQIGRTP